MIPVIVVFEFCAPKKIQNNPKHDKEPLLNGSGNDPTRPKNAPETGHLYSCLSIFVLKKNQKTTKGLTFGHPAFFVTAFRSPQKTYSR